MAVEQVPTVALNTVTPVPTSKFSTLGYKFSHFNPFQSAFCDEYEKDTNVVCSAPTGSGKSVIAEISTLHSVVNNSGRAIFLAPMKSLTLEKFTDWTKEGHPFATFKPAILTGDFKLSDAKKKELQEAKVICMTSEMLDSRTRRMKSEGNAWLLEVTVLIVDEAHLIGMQNEGTQPLDERGHKLESAIMRFSQLNKNARIIMLSATLPNLPQLGTWLEKLNGKKTNIIVSDYKPQPVEWHLETYPEQTGYGSYHINKDRMFSTAIETLRVFPNDMWLVFCHSKNDGRRMQSMISEQLSLEVPFHCADLEKDERVNIENGFRDRTHRIVIATSTLAYGSIAKDTIISLCNGTKKKVQDLKIGDEILSFNEKTGIIEHDSIKMKEKYKPIVEIEIELENGRKIKVDRKHPFYIRTKSGIELKLANNLCESDDLVLLEELQF